MNTKNTITKDHEILNNLLFNIFAVNLITHKKLEMTIQILTPQITIVTNIIKITITIDTEIMIDIVTIVENIRKTTIDISQQRYYNRSRSPYRSRFDNYYQRRTPSRSHIDLHTEITQITDITLA